MRNRFKPWAPGLLLAALSSTTLQAELVSLGEGSYTTRRPASCKPLPEEIFREAPADRATPTNQWWSSIVWQRYSQNLFPHPLALKCSAEGLVVHHPGTAIVANAAGIVGGGIGERGDFVIGQAPGRTFEKATLVDHSDWFVRVAFPAGEDRLTTAFGHGSPFVYCRHQGGAPVLRFAEVPRVWAGSGPVRGVSVRGHHYGLFGPTGSTWEGVDTAEWKLRSPRDYFSVALLPDDRPETLERFAARAHRHVTDTGVEREVGAGVVTARFRFTTEALEGGEGDTLFALYPHQWKYLEGATIGLDYPSVRGTMKLAEGSGFVTRVPVQGLLPHLPGEGIADRARTRDYLLEDPPQDPTEFADTYWEGKRLGKLATLSGIAEALGEHELRDGYLREIRARLENWFTASPAEGSPLFYYNRRWGTLIGSKPSYGSDAELNDHHFHYGYFIRAAAELARHDPEWSRRWGPMVELLIRDIASSRRDAPMFPHLRCFDLYAGHSWASGHANFGDGNNQESSSESLNAWYGIAMWGAATGDRSLRDLGIFLFNVERTAVEEYWFDVEGTNFPERFPQVALGMVWGGKGAFATWFSGEIDCIHGINWLPFTPASVYMGRHPAYVKRNHDRILAERKQGKDYNSGWGDLIVMFNALQDPAAAAAYLDATPDCKLEGGNTHAFMYHWIHTLRELGLVDPEVTADHPFVNVFRKGDRRTYAAYHFGDEPLEVRFSDGFRLTAEPGTVTVGSRSE